MAERSRSTTRARPGVEASGRPAATDRDVDAARALLELGRLLIGVTLRAVAAAPVSLTVPQHRVLVTISTEGPRRVGALADDLGVNQSNASRIVARLEARRLVRRVPDGHDARASLVKLTGTGREVLAAVNEHRLAALLEVVVQSPGDADVLSGALLQLSQASEAKAADGGGQ